MRRVEPSSWRKRPVASAFADGKQPTRESKPLVCRLSVVAAVAALLSLASCATPGAVSQKPVAIGDARRLEDHGRRRPRAGAVARSPDPRPPGVARPSSIVASSNCACACHGRAPIRAFIAIASSNRACASS